MVRLLRKVQVKPLLSERVADANSNRDSAAV